MNRIDIVDQGLVQPAGDGIFGYCGWPSVIRGADGSIVVAYSGSRIGHLCPFGREYVQRSYDEGKTWTNPIVVYNSPLDDRDAGLVRLPGREMALCFFSTAKEEMLRSFFQHTPDRKVRDFCLAYLDMLDDDVDAKYAGRWTAYSHDDGFTWGQPERSPIFTPGGFKALSNGTYLCVSQRTADEKAIGLEARGVFASRDAHHWEMISRVPACQENMSLMNVEPECVQMPNGNILCLLRMENTGFQGESDHIFTLAASISDDLGKSWSVPKMINNMGAPAGLLSHSSGAVIATYGNRKAAYGIKAMVSRDCGETWDIDIDLFIPQQDDFDAGSHADNGYPKSMELDNGDIFTVFYSKERNTRKCAIRYVRWRFS